mmetsp:Transcript_10936/g.15746  ORF Transcript_10936/g.15746 Transcript_10936/m.15746 type:complete len:105 (+) Transcript_10936:176-490(+)
MYRPPNTTVITPDTPAAREFPSNCLPAAINRPDTNKSPPNTAPAKSDALDPLRKYPMAPPMNINNPVTSEIHALLPPFPVLYIMFLRCVFVSVHSLWVNKNKIK